jgi:hypothetical protein
VKGKNCKATQRCQGAIAGAIYIKIDNKLFIASYLDVLKIKEHPYLVPSLQESRSRVNEKEVIVEGVQNELRSPRNSCQRSH